MIKQRGFLLMRLALVAFAGGSIALAALPVLRHMAGIIVLETPEQPPLPAQVQVTAVDVRPILAFAPFGRAALPETAQTSRTAAPLDVRLKGILAARSGVSVALLEVADQTSRFREGQIVTQSYALTQITSDQVQLSNATQTITLRFDESKTSEKTEDAEQLIDTTNTLFDRVRNGLVVPARFERPKAPETTSEYIDYWRTRIRKNPQAVLDEIGLTPTDQGYVIASQHDVGVRLAGLKAGDLVRSVNGQAVGNPEDDRRLYDRIAVSGQARLEIERGGRLLTMSFPLR